MQLFSVAFQLLISTLSPILIGLMILGLAAGVLKVSTQIEDRTFGFAAKFFLVSLMFYFFVDNWGASLIEFTKQVWGNLEYYRPVI